MTQLQNAASDPVPALKCELASEMLRSSGMLRLRVAGWSMLPALVQGDLLVFERATRDELSEGDIVLFGRDGRLFAHRVIGVSTGRKEGSVLTQGDAVPRPDPPVADRELYGRVLRIVRNGKPMQPARSLSIPEHVLAALLRRSQSAVRIVLGMLRIRQLLKESVVPCQS
jgi:signal peptidase I